MTTEATEGTTEASEISQEDKQNRLRKAYGVATRRLREERRQEFDAYYTEAAKELGVEYQPRPTAEQKAEQELAELLEKFPALRDKVSEEG